MSRPIIKIHNISTGEIVEREMNDKEFAVYEKESADLSAQKLAIEEAESAKNALLLKLGISNEEAKLLLS